MEWVKLNEHQKQQPQGYSQAGTIIDQDILIISYILVDPNILHASRITRKIHKTPANASKSLNHAINLKQEQKTLNKIYTDNAGIKINTPIHADGDGWYCLQIYIFLNALEITTETFVRYQRKQENKQNKGDK